MNPVEYTLSLQRLFVILGGLGFVGLAAILVFLNPLENSLYVWALLATVLIFLTSLLTLIAFWWFYTLRKQILSITQVNQIVFQSLISSCVVIVFLVMQQTRQLSLWTGLVLLIVYVFYELWINSDNT